MNQEYKRLGMGQHITRRDFINGAAVTVAMGASATHAHSASAPVAPSSTASSPYPPAATGWQGQTPSSYAALHALRDDEYWDKAGPIAETGEVYDLVVVGAGISGLAAALLYRQKTGPEARILILDTLHDFGGHAARNEFTASNGQLMIGYGGSQSLQSPSFFSPAVKKMMQDLDIQFDRFEKYFDSKFHETHGLSESYFFTKETYGVDKLVKITEKAAEWVPQTPLNVKAKADLIALMDSPIDYFPKLDRAAKFEKLSSLIYRDFLLDVVKVDPQVATYLQETTSEYFGCGIDAISCVDAWGAGNPGFDAMDLGDTPYKTMSPTARLLKADPDEYIYHFPDGNASVARLMVRKLIPSAMAGSTMEDIVLAKCDYGQLDLEKNNTRIRLQSAVVRVKHNGAVDTATDVEVVYQQDKALKRVVAKHVIIGAFHQAIPFFAPEVKLKQSDAMRDQQKIPLVYCNVLIRNWEAFAKLGIHGFNCISPYWDSVKMDFPVSMGGYQFSSKPSEPMLLHLVKIPATGKGQPLREQAEAGRRWLMKQSFENMELGIRDLLDRSLGAAGFDVTKDIEAITINRWGHGYSYEYMRPFDTYWPDGDLPITTARQGWGRIAIANADAGAYAYANSAIDQATRAVREVLGEAVDAAPAPVLFPGPPVKEIGL